MGGGETIPLLFARARRRSPANLAVADAGTALSYRELDAESNRVARHLRALGLPPEALVGLCAERSLRLPILLLGVLKAGAAFLPLDPRYPPARLRRVLAQARPPVVLADAAAGDLGSPAAPSLSLEAEWPEIARRSAAPVRASLSPESLAYAIFTSGSTGEPKGVLMSHEGVTSRVRRTRRLHRLGSADRVLHLASLGFDLAIWEIFVPLLCGAGLVLGDPERLGAGGYLGDLVERRRITVARFVPPVLQRLLDCGGLAGCGGLRRVITGGDRMTARLMDGFFAATGAELHNQYGPSERPSSISWRCARGAAAPAAVPIGKPLAGTAAYLLDESLRQVGDGAAGEIFLGGGGLARGYLGDPRSTAERFLPDPWAVSPGARMYRTGDRARRLPGGDLDFLGRGDFQVKIHGMRVELSEIEAELRRLERVREAVVVVREDSSPEARELVAYLVGEPLPEPALRARLAVELPPAMLPRWFVWLAEMPLGEHGKIDRRDLARRVLESPAPATALPTAARGPFERAASSPFERCALGAWSERLGRPALGVDDNVFELGATSLDALEVGWRLQERTGAAVRLSDIFAHPTVASLASAVSARLEGDGDPGPVALPRRDLYPLAPAQRRLWLFEQAHPGTAVHNIGRAQWIEGPLDGGAFAAAARRLVARHDALRARLSAVDGEPRLAIRRRLDGWYERCDLSRLAAPEAAVSRRLARELRRPFRLDREPLLRLRLLRLAEDRHALLVVVHHLVCDGWSLDVLLRDLTELYLRQSAGRGAALPPLAFQYQDYAVWHAGLLAGGRAAADRDYWRAKLRDAPPPAALPADREPPPGAAPARRRAGFALSRRLTLRLRALARERETTWTVVALAAVKVLLYRHTRQPDIVIGTVGAGRSHRSLRDQVGFFVNTLALRDKVDARGSFSSLLGAVQRTVTEAHRHDLPPFDQVVSDLGLAPGARNPLFEVVILFERERRTFDPGGARPRLIALPPAASAHGLVITLRDRGDRIEGEMDYDARRFEPWRIARLARQLRSLLAAASRSPELPLAALELASAAERRQVASMGRGPEEPSPPASIVDELAAWVRARPDAPAVVEDGAVVTYRELARRADRVARELALRFPLAAEDRIGVVMERSPRLVAALLGILQAGCAYVPLDPAWPEERLRSVLAEAGCRAVLVDPGGDHPGPGERRARLEISDRLLASPPPTGAALRPPRPAQLAFVIFTSGSTGLPKGVMVEHRSMVDLARWHRRRFASVPGARALLYTSIAFDASSYEVWSGLLSGASLHPVHGETRRDLRLLARFARAEQIDLASIPTRVFEELWRSGLLAGSSLTVLTGGERLGDLPGPGCRAVNCYGPTEATVTATCFPLAERRRGGAVPVGRPIDRAEVLVLDAGRRPCPIGVAGEIHIGGAGVTRGYLGRPDLTAERFVPHPWRPGARLYATGDLGRWDEEGLLHCLGRDDEQVKVRGFRVELGEIEATLRRFPGVDEAAVVAVRCDDLEPRLIAYLVAAGDLSLRELAAHLAARLPRPMVPADYVLLGALPRLTSGKLDRRALAGRALSAPPAAAVRAAAPTPTERRLIELYEAATERRPLDATADFFAVGGTSLRAMRLALAIQRTFGVELPVARLFELPRVSDLAAEIDRRPPESELAVPMQGAAGPLVYLLPSLLGSAGALHRLAAAIGGATLVGLDVPGDGRAAPCWADAIGASRPSAPLVLLGYSVGGNLAFDLACELARREVDVSDLVLLDSARRLAIPRFDADTRRRWRAAVAAALEDPAARPDDRDGASEGSLRARSSRVLASWCSGKDTGSIAGDLHFVAAEDTPGERIDLWTDATRGHFRSYRGFGRHLAMLQPENLERNGDLLTRLLGEVAARRLAPETTPP